MVQKRVSLNELYIRYTNSTIANSNVSNKFTGLTLSLSTVKHYLFKAHSHKLRLMLTTATDHYVSLEVEKYLSLRKHSGPMHIFSGLQEVWISQYGLPNAKTWRSCDPSRNWSYKDFAALILNYAILSSILIGC